MSRKKGGVAMEMSRILGVVAMEMSRILGVVAMELGVAFRELANRRDGTRGYGAHSPNPCIFTGRFGLPLGPCCECLAKWVGEQWECLAFWV